MTAEQREAIRAVLNSLYQFTYGPIGPDIPYQGTVVLTAKQYRALFELESQ